MVFAELPNFFASDWWLAIGLAVVVILYVALRLMNRKANPPAQPSAPQRAVQQQMQNLLVELSELSRQINGQLDARAATLQRLIKEADDRIAQLKTYPSEGLPAPVDRTDARYAEIYRLADAGQSPMQIAQQLHRPQGEIELILALRPKA